MIKNIFKIISTSSVLIPTITFAALDGVKGLLTAFGGLLNSVIPVIFGLALVYFFWGVTQFILHDAGNEKTREEGKKKIVWGVVALFIFLSIYGILGFIGKLVNIPVSGSGGNSGSGFNNNTSSNTGFSSFGEDE